MALTSLRSTMPISKKPAYSAFMAAWILNQSDLGVGEAGDQIPEPLRIDHIVGVDNADDLGIVSGFRHRQPQRRGLEPLEVVHTNELEARAELAAARLDRLPERRIGRIVDDDHALEIRIVELRHRIDGAQQHVGRLPVGRNMDRDFRRIRAGCRLRHTQEPRRLVAERDGRHLVQPGAHDGAEQAQQRKRDAEGDHLAVQEIVAMPVHQDACAPMADHMVRGGEQRCLANRRARKCQDRE